MTLHKPNAIFIMLLLLVSMAVPFTTPPAIQDGDPAQPPSLSKVGESTSGLGASVSLSYQCQNKTWSEWWPEQFHSMESDLWYDAGLQSMIDDDSQYWSITATEANTGNDVGMNLYFKIYSPYTSLNKFEYDWKWYDNDVGSPSVTVSLYVGDPNEASGWHTQSTPSENTFVDSSFTLDDSAVDSGYLFGRFYIYCLSSLATYQLTLVIDELVLTYEPVEEIRRSSYSVQGSKIRYTIQFEPWDHTVDCTLTVPSDWTYVDCNPECSESSNVFSCLIPSTYEAVYEADVLSTANLQLGFSDSFEDGWSHWDTTLNPVDSWNLEYVVVLDGAASLYMVADVGEGFKLQGWGDTFDECWVIYSVYLDSGSLRLGVYDDGGWSYDTVQTTTGEWITRVFYVSDLDDAGANENNIFIESRTANAEIYWDAIAIYNSSLSMGETVSGTCNHIFSNGYRAASFVDVELGLWDASYAWQEYQTVTTDADGEWSFDTDDFSISFSSQSYHLWTWVYSDANGEWDCDAHTESTTDWSAGGYMAGTLTYSTSTDAQEGLYSVQMEAQSDSSGFNWYYDPTNTATADWDVNYGAILTFWWKTNNTGSSYHYSGYRDDDNDAAHFYTQNDFDFAVDTWTFVAVPSTSDYFTFSWEDNFEEEDTSQILHRVADSVDDHFKIHIDSLNIIQKYTHDTLTYPFTVAVDTTLWMTFKRGTGQLIPWETFIIYVDNETAPLPYVAVTGSTTTGTDYTVNITVVDDFNYTVWQDTAYAVETSGNSYLRQVLSVYVMNLNNRHEMPCYAVVERNDETWRSPSMGWMQSIPYLVYGSISGVNYTVTWYRDHDDHLEETRTWTVYQQDINVYNGYQKPDVDVPEIVIPEEPDLPRFWDIAILFVLVIVVVLLIIFIIRKPKQRILYADQLPQRPRDDTDFRKLTPQDYAEAERRAQIALRERIARERKQLAEERKRR